MRTTLYRETFPQLVGMVTLCILSFPKTFSSGRENPNRSFPNILIILVDDLGYGDLSINGGTDIYTPNIDKLFKEGIQFVNFYSNSTVSSPTRASLLTGRYPDLVGVPGVIRTHSSDSWGHLIEGVPMLPEKLKEVGYRTALIGKWHLGLQSPNLPNQRGFDYFHGFLGDMMDDYWTHLRHGQNYMRLNMGVIHPDGHATDLFTDWAIDYLNDAEREEGPFFLYLAYNAPHFPVQPPREWIEKVKKREPGLPDRRARNVAFVEHLDMAIGRVLTTVETTGLSRNTIVVFSSDNGGSLPHGASNGPLRGGKQDMFEGGIKVPACIAWSGMINSGINHDVGVTMDIFPTLCEIAGIEIDHPVDGISMLQDRIGEESILTDRVLFFMRREGGTYGGQCYYAVRYGDYKLLQNSPFEPYQLFNITGDPFEREPLKNDSVFYHLKNKISQHILRSGVIPWRERGRE